MSTKIQMLVKTLVFYQRLCEIAKLRENPKVSITALSRKRDEKHQGNDLEEFLSKRNSNPLWVENGKNIENRTFFRDQVDL